jgi:hypothetical protein
MFKVCNKNKMKNKKLLLAILTVGVFFLFGQTKKAEAFSGGSGTSGDPYKISTCQELQDIGTNLSADYILTQNVDCLDTKNWNDGAGFATIGSLNDWNPFSGTLDGQNFTISGLYQNGSYEGLFYDVNSGTVKNLKIDGIKISTDYCSGTIACYIENSTLENIKVTNSEIDSSYGAVGGIANVVSSLSLNEVSFSGKISNTYSGNSDVGGLVAFSDRSLIITNSYSEGSIISPEGSNIGGLVGRAGIFQIENTYSTMDVSGADDVGGLVGYIENNTKGTARIVNSYATGDVSGTDHVGGLVGYDYYAQIINSYSVGNVNGSGSGVGGLMGYTSFGGDNVSGFIINDGWYKRTSGIQNAIGYDNTLSASISDITYNVTDPTVFYSKSHAIYTTGDNAWNFNSVWYEQGNDYPKFAQSSNSDSADNDSDYSDSDSPVKAKITSWSAFQYSDNSSCGQKLSLTIKGKHFTNDTEVMIGGKESSSVKKKSSRKIVAKFCLAKLLDNQADHTRVVSVKNPNTSEDKADKQIDLDNISYQLTTNNFDPSTTDGVKNIQQALVGLGFLDPQYVTGVYGSITTEAVKKFQADNGLPQTGTVGPLTKAKLEEKSS